MISNLPDAKTIYHRLKSSAKKRHIYFNLTVLDIMRLDYPITCPILGIPLKFNKNQFQDNSYTIDRIDNNKGYELGNIIIISYRANRMKNNGTIEELKLIQEFYQDLLDDK